MRTTTKTVTVTQNIVHAIMTLVMMMWCGGVWADDNSTAATDMLIYHTNFQDWDYSSPATPLYVQYSCRPDRNIFKNN